MTYTVRNTDNTITTFDLEAVCPLTNQTFQSHINNIDDGFPYIIAKIDENWAHGPAATAEKVHLFALFRDEFQSIGEVSSKLAQQLYFFDGLPPNEFPDESRQEVVNAIRLYYQGRNVSKISRWCFDNACEEAKKKGSMALLVGLALSTFKEAKEEALEYFKKGAEKGNGEAAYQAALVSDSKNAREYFAIANKSGLKEAKKPLARIYREGTGGQVRIDLAKKLLLELAEEGDLKARFDYAELVRKENKKEAFDNYMIVARADKTHSLASFKAGLLLRDGAVIDPKMEREMFLQAADQGHKLAALYAGEMLEKGIGGPVEKERAVPYFKLAEEKGGYKREELEYPSPTSSRSTSSRGSSRRNLSLSVFRRSVSMEPPESPREYDVRSRSTREF